MVQNFGLTTAGQTYVPLRIQDVFKSVLMSTMIMAMTCCSLLQAEALHESCNALVASTPNFESDCGFGLSFWFWFFFFVVEQVLTTDFALKLARRPRLSPSRTDAAYEMMQ